MGLGSYSDSNQRSGRKYNAGIKMKTKNEARTETKARGTDAV